MNLAQRPHSDADRSVSSVHRQSLVSCIRKPFLTEFITPSRVRSVAIRDLVEPLLHKRWRLVVLCPSGHSIPNRGRGRARVSRLQHLSGSSVNVGSHRHSTKHGGVFPTVFGAQYDYVVLGVL